MLWLTLKYLLGYALISFDVIINNHLVAADATVEQDSEKPHIIFILADDLGFDDISFHGSQEFLTPNIDALGYHGKILEHLYAPAICTPSRGAFMTGRYPIHTGTQHFVISNEEPWGLPTNITMLPEIFQKAGYSTNLVGKWHLGFAKREFTPTHRGFDYHYGYWGGFVDYYQRRSLMPVPGYSMGYDFRRNMELECAERGTYATELFTREAERIILANNNTKPLLLILSHLAVHTGNSDDPLQAPEEEIAKFQYIKDPNRRTYAAMVSRLDQSVGRIINTLEKANMLKNSIVIFHSDNGGPSVGLFANSASNFPLRGQKNTPWEGGVRVAGAIWSPLMRERASLFHPTMYIGDWLPTLAAAANIPLNRSALRFDGINLWPALSGDSSNHSQPKKNREIVHFLDDIWHVVAFQQGDWKYVKGTTSAGRLDNLLTYRELADTDPRSLDYFAAVENSTTSQVLRKYDESQLQREQVEQLRNEATIRCGTGVQRSCNALLEECLYNVAVDPCERNNLATSREYSDVLARMRRRVRQHRRTAWPPGNQKGYFEYSPSHHRCAWTNFLEESASEESFDCGLYGMPCELDS
ncbi:arylsulfatase B [Rhagoletis pomonella]|uniref:arylsulfatase B n=1 Tax=Rhagoletis pomonella TaxID=28610 RepID=UPI001786EC15|nr:arylsulfatase B [Rhagoletis pomonella]